MKNYSDINISTPSLILLPLSALPKINKFLWLLSYSHLWVQTKFHSFLPLKLFLSLLQILPSPSHQHHPYLLLPKRSFSNFSFLPACLGKHISVTLHFKILTFYLRQIWEYYKTYFKELKFLLSGWTSLISTHPNWCDLLAISEYLSLLKVG